MLKNRLDQLTTILRRIFRLEVLAAVVVAITIVAVSYNTSGIILQNYKLEKQVREAQQKVDIAQLELDSQALKNKYYQTDAFLDIAARKQLSKGLDGEKLVIVPKSVALSYVSVPTPDESETTANSDKPTNNVEKWLHFLSGDLEFIDQD